MCKRKYVAAIGKVYEENSEMVVFLCIQQA